MAAVKRKTPVCHALIVPRLAWGVSPRALGFIWGPALFIGVLTGQIFSWVHAGIVVAAGFVVHLVIRHVFAKEPRIFAMYAVYSVLPDAFMPFTREDMPGPFKRPGGFGFGIRL